MKASANQYAKTLLELTDGKTERETSDVVKKFAEVLKKDGQMKNAAKITEKFSEIYNAKHGIVEAQVITKDKIGESEMKKIKSYVKEKYDAKEVIASNIIDEKIKGGVIIKVGDEVLDASISAQLKRLERELVK
jgi:F-type H+-transporting ATPase subunit delta